jgi:hypothetical protein
LLIDCIYSAELPGLNNWSELHVDTDLAFDCDAFMEEYDRLPGIRLVTCVSRGEVEDSDAADDNTEESTEDAATGGEEDAGDEEQTGDDNGSAHMEASGVGAVLLTSLFVIGLIRI